MGETSGFVRSVHNYLSNRHVREWPESGIEQAYPGGPGFGLVSRMFGRMIGALAPVSVDSIRLLALASEYKDDATGAHIVRTGCHSALIAENLGFHPQAVQQVFLAAPLHDVGKIGIPDRILLKPGKLNPEEFEIMKSHTIIGSRILSNSRSEVIRLARRIALSHHERWDGKGYPENIAQTKIPFAARIVALVDAFDAMTSTRPYREACTADEACDEIRRERGKQFDPKIVDVFFETLEGILEIRAKIAWVMTKSTANASSELFREQCLREQ